MPIPKILAEAARRARLALLGFRLHCARCKARSPRMRTSGLGSRLHLEGIDGWTFGAPKGWRCPDCTALRATSGGFLATYDSLTGGESDG